MALLDHPRGALEYLRYEGSPSLPTIVLLHEGLGSTAQWGRLPASLAATTGLSVIVYSRHGYGGSQGYGPDGPRYLHTEALDILPGLLESLGVSAPLLVGHSDGATIAAIYAGAHPVSAAVLIAPHVVIEDATISGIQSTAAAFDAAVRPTLAMYHDDPGTLFRRWSSVWLSAEFSGFDIADSLREIDAPLLVIQGDDDNYGTEIQWETVGANARGSVSTAVLDGHGHHPHLQDPEAVCAMIADFFRTVINESGTADRA